MTKARTAKRSKSGACSICLHCGKKLRGSKGLEMHINQQHGDKAQVKPGKVAAE